MVVETPVFLLTSLSKQPPLLLLILVVRSESVTGYNTGYGGPCNPACISVFIVASLRSSICICVYRASIYSYTIGNGNASVNICDIAHVGGYIDTTFTEDIIGYIHSSLRMCICGYRDASFPAYDTIDASVPAYITGYMTPVFLPFSHSS
jgi:hypothetical protein